MCELIIGSAIKCIETEVTRIQSLFQWNLTNTPGQYEGSFFAQSYVPEEFKTCISTSNMPKDLITVYNEMFRADRSQEYLIEFLFHVFRIARNMFNDDLDAKKRVYFVASITDA